MTQAQVVITEMYQITNNIPLGENRHVFDLAYVDNGSLCVSVVNTENRDPSCRSYAHPIRYISTYGSYFCCKKEWGTEYFIFCADHSLQYLSSRDIGPPRVLFEKAEGGYTPNGIAVCKSGAILVALWNHEVQDKSRGKILKITLSGKKLFEMETDKNRRLFICPTYIAENINGDICVCDVGVVVVTDIGGMRRFRYVGLSGDHHFDPYGICCDSRCNIIIADMKNDKIHVINQNGEFLHYIQYDGMKMPRALCIDDNDNLYVGEWGSDSVKVVFSQK